MISKKIIINKLNLKNKCNIINLKAKYIIHTVGPVWYGGEKNEAELLAACYENCLKLAQKNNLKSIAFPSIGTGVYRFPKPEAANIAVRTVKNTLLSCPSIEKVFFVVFDDENFHIYDRLIY